VKETCNGLAVEFFTFPLRLFNYSLSDLCALVELYRLQKEIEPARRFVAIDKMSRRIFQPVSVKYSTFVREELICADKAGGKTMKVGSCAIITCID